MPDITPLPAGYAAWLAELKTRIHTAQQRAALAVNRDLLLPRLLSGQIDVETPLTEPAGIGRTS